MNDLLQFIKNGLSLDANDIILKAAARNEAELADLNTENMLKGEKNDGSEIEPEYSPTWQEIKGRKTPNLYDTGDFQSGLFFDVKDQEIDVGSTDWKEEKLVGKYGREIFGVQSKQFIETIDADVAEIIIDELWS